MQLILTPKGLRAGAITFPCAIGRGGLQRDKREGDGATPRGRHRVMACLYRPDRMVKPCSWARAIKPGDLWSDDPADSAYNHLVRAPYGHSHEKMRRADPLYDLVWITDWNWPIAAPGKGSAIFVHQWRKPRHPTEGCLALRRDHLRQLTAWITPGTELIIL